MSNQHEENIMGSYEPEQPRQPETQQNYKTSLPDKLEGGITIDVKPSEFIMDKLREIDSLSQQDKVVTEAELIHTIKYAALEMAHSGVNAVKFPAVAARAILARFPWIKGE